MNSTETIQCQQCGAPLPVGPDASSPIACPNCQNTAAAPAPALCSSFPPPETIAATLACSHVTIIRAGAGFLYCRGDRENGEHFGIHVLPARLEGVSPEDKAGFLPDATAGAALRHPNIVSVYHFAELEGHYLLVTEWLDGPTLEDRFRHHQVRWDQTEQIGQSLAEGLHHAHEQGITHRALNSAAIYLTPGGDVKILGFGLANVFLSAWAEQLAASAKTTADYIAPELHVPGLVGATPQSDIFGLGRILYECYCGELPRAAFSSMPSQKAGVPTCIDDAVLGAMHYEPAQRPQTIVHLMEELAGLRTRVRAVHSEEAHSEIGKYTWRSHEAQFPWFRSLAAIAITIAILAGLAHIVVKQRRPPGDPTPISQVSVINLRSALAMLERADDLHRKDETSAAIALVTSVAREAAVGEPVLKRMMGILENWREYELAIDLGKTYVERDGSQDEKKEQLLALLDQRVDVIRKFLELRELAAAARAAGDDLVENEALHKASALMTRDKEITALIHENPVFVYSQVMDGIQALKSAHPEQETWRIYAYVDRGTARLDLSGNAALTSIDSLQGIPITELNLNQTGVGDLSPLSDAPLETLDITYTEVRDISPLLNTPLTLLSFYRTPVKDVTVLDQIPTLRVARGDAAGQPHLTIRPPDPGQVWENHIGMRFRSFGSDDALMSVWETRRADYVTYAGHRKIAVFPEMLRYEDGRWLNDGASWKRPGYAARADHPVVGVSHRDISDFCGWLTRQAIKEGHIKKGQFYRLPTDTEWNLAVGEYDNPLLSPKTRILQPRKSSPDNSNPALQPLEYLEGISSENESISHLTTAQTGGPNDWIGPVARFDSHNGFFDLRGNVREWCGDATDQQKTSFIVRGSDFISGQFDPRTRSALDRSSRYSDLGFRVVLQLRPPRQKDEALITHIQNLEWDLAGQVALQQSIQHPVEALRNASRDYLVLARWLTGTCPPESDLHAQTGLKQFGTDTYFLARIPLPWNDAQNLAAAVGGHLATVTNIEKQRWIEDNFLLAQNAHTLWLGASYDGRAWSWNTEEPWDFQHGEIPKPTDSSANLILAPAPLGPDAPHHEAAWLPDAGREAHCFLIQWDSATDPTPITPSPAETSELSQAHSPDIAPQTKDDSLP